MTHAEGAMAGAATASGAKPTAAAAAMAAVTVAAARRERFMMNSLEVMNGPDFKGGRRERIPALSRSCWELERALIVRHFTCRE
ncbi:hypothetical protein GCM10010336_50390 [Streptomyces goshikiensis]|nr:hypothetical protein GCM10010336_50390 [Streptomyces goshikiensis]